MPDVRQSGPVIEVTAGGAVTAFRAGAIVAGAAVHADNTTSGHKGLLRGVFRASKSIGETSQLQVFGPMRNTDWAWTAEQPVYLGTSGTLTQTRPASGFVQVIGWADTPTQLFINPREASDQAERHIHKQEQFTLGGSDITNKYVLLALTPISAVDVQLFVAGAPPLRYSADFQMDGSNAKKLTWSGLGLDGLLSVGDQFTVHYFREPT